MEEHFKGRDFFAQSVHSVRPSTAAPTVNSFFASQNYNSTHNVQTQANGPNDQATLFPTKPLSEEKVDAVVRDVRNALAEQRISFSEVFKLFDFNADGFLTFPELSHGLDKILKLSTPTKEGLFAYLDKQKIGMIDYPTFLDFIKKSSNKHKMVINLF